jgi:hypothetical protein
MSSFRGAAFFWSHECNPILGAAVKMHDARLTSTVDPFKKKALSVSGCQRYGLGIAAFSLPMGDCSRV